MSYYEFLKEKIDPEIASLAKAFQQGERQLAKTSHRMTEDIALVDRLRVEKQKLLKLFWDTLKKSLSVLPYFFIIILLYILTISQCVLSYAT